MLRDAVHTTIKYNSMTILNIYCELCKINQERCLDPDHFTTFFLNILNIMVLYPPQFLFFLNLPQHVMTLLSLVPLTGMLLLEVLVCVSAEKSPKSA